MAQIYFVLANPGRGKQNSSLIRFVVHLPNCPAVLVGITTVCVGVDVCVCVCVWLRHVSWAEVPPPFLMCTRPRKLNKFYRPPNLGGTIGGTSVDVRGWRNGQVHWEARRPPRDALAEQVEGHRAEAVQNDRRYC